MRKFCQHVSVDVKAILAMDLQTEDVVHKVLSRLVNSSDKDAVAFCDAVVFDAVGKMKRSKDLVAALNEVGQLTSCDGPLARMVSQMMRSGGDTGMPATSGDASTWDATAETVKALLLERRHTEIRESGHVDRTGDSAGDTGMLSNGVGSAVACAPHRGAYQDKAGPGPYTPWGAGCQGPHSYWLSPLQPHDMSACRTY